MTSLADYLDDLQATGRYVFTTEDAVEALGTSVDRRAGCGCAG